MDQLEAKLSAPPKAELPSDPPADHEVEDRPVDDRPAYTWEQLSEAVQEGKITDGVAQQIWSDQNRRLAVKEARETIAGEMAAQTTAAKVDAEIGRYRDLVPQIMDQSSEQRQRVTREFHRLTNDMGFPKNELRTELAALQAAFGPIDALAKAVKPKKEGHQDVSHDDGGAEDDDKAEDPGGAAPSSLGAEEKRYYENAIGRGVYKDWGAVKEELKFANSRVRRKYGARV